MANFSKLEYMILFGKPIWPAYKDPNEILQVIRLKFIGSRKLVISML